MNRTWSLVPLSLVLLGGCTSELAIDRGDAYALTDADDPARAYAGLVAVPNLDDDDRNGRPDWEDARIADDTDTAPFWIQPEQWRRLQPGQLLRLRLVSGAEDVRVWQDGRIVLGENDGARSPLELDLARSREPLRFDVEVRAPGATGLLALARLKASGDEIERVEVPVVGAPLVMNTHLQPAELVMAVAVDFGGAYDNAALIAGYEAALGEDFLAVDGNEYQGDVWIQDEIEFATYSSPTSRVDLVIDSIRDRGLDDVAEDLFLAPEVLVQTWGSGWATSQDSFGNLEATPPITVDGVQYPFGRVYWGDSGGDLRIVQELDDMFRGMAVQAPFELDSSWLCVGHVDEFMSWIPDPTAPKGWRLVYTDIAAAWELLERMDPETALPRYEEAHGYRTVGDLVGDAGARALNDDLWEDYLLPNLEILRREVGVTDEDILWLPGLFERAEGCGGGTAALIPGMANLIVANRGGERPVIALADPFLRTDDGRQEDDPMIAHVRDLFGPGFDVVFLDDFWVYHYGLGEVHCGTNVIRTPTERWWTAAGPLLGGH